jgi:hypothetical protein
LLADHLERFPSSVVRGHLWARPPEPSYSIVSSSSTRAAAHRGDQL